MTPGLGCRLTIEIALKQRSQTQFNTGRGQIRQKKGSLAESLYRKIVVKVYLFVLGAYSFYHSGFQPIVPVVKDTQNKLKHKMQGLVPQWEPKGGS